MQIYDKETVIYCHNYSYWLYNQGDTVEQITENVALIPLRAKVHMARYLASGDIDVHEFVDTGTLEKVEAYFEKHLERIILILA